MTETSGHRQSVASQLNVSPKKKSPAVTMDAITPNEFVHRDVRQWRAGQIIRFEEEELKSSITAMIEHDLLFCVIIGFVIPSDIEEEEKKGDDDIAFDIDFNVDLDSIEIAVFEAPSAFQSANQQQSGQSGNDQNIGRRPSLKNAMEPKLSLQLLCDLKAQRVVEYHDIFGIPTSAESENEHESQCRICFCALANVVLIPCRHCCCCTECYRHIEMCPICRKPIRQTLRWKVNQSL